MKSVSDSKDESEVVLFVLLFLLATYCAAVIELAPPPGSTYAIPNAD